MTRLITLTLLVPLGLVSGALGQASTQPEVDVTLETQLAEVDRRAAAITDLSAEFVQLKRTPLLKKPLESKGTLRVKGDRMRWDTTAPSSSVMTIDADDLQLYSPEQKLLEIYPMQHGLGQVAASPLPRLTVVREHFRVERAEWPDTDQSSRKSTDWLAIRLVPREDSLREHIQEVHVLLNLETGCARAVRITDADGDELEITFRDVRLNPGVRDDQVCFDPPKGTVVSRPLDGGVDGGSRP